MNLSFAACFCLTASCATLFQGTNEEIDIASDPAGANATVSDGRSGVTPFTIKENRDSDLQIHFSKPGYQPYDVSDDSHVEWGYLVSDLFFTGLIGLGVDGLDGAMFQHSDKMVTAHLEPNVPAVAAAPTLSPAVASAPAAVAPAAVSPAAAVVPTAAHSASPQN